MGKVNEQPLDKLLPQGLQDWLNAYHEFNAQANDIHNKIVDRVNERTTLKMITL